MYMNINKYFQYPNNIENIIRLDNLNADDASVYTIDGQ